jgi:O-antigen/teichoic acid export membrane protein
MFRNIYTLSYFLQGVTSLIVIFFATYFFDTHAVGKLSLIIAFQFFLSQVKAFGLHFSALYYCSKNNIQKIEMHHFINVVLMASFFSIIFFSIFPYISPLFVENQLLDYTAHLTVYGFLAACNKVYISNLNANKQFKFLGIIFLIKSLIILTSIGLVYLLNFTFNNYLFFVILIPEFIFFTIYFIHVFKHNTLLNINSFSYFFKKDLNFGKKSFWGALLFDASSKTDVIMIGMYMDAYTIGVYTFISLFSDIIFQFSTFLRSYFNPEITKAYYSDKSTFTDTIKKIKTKSYVLLTIFNTLLFIFLIILIYFYPALNEYKSGLMALIISYVFMTAFGGYIPLMQTFGQIGKPLIQSYSFLIIFVINVSLNLALIPSFGIEGAALATGIAYIFYILVFDTYLKICLKNMVF